MKKLISHFIKYPIYSNAIILVTAIIGIISLTLMPRSFFPELAPNKIYVYVIVIQKNEKNNKKIKKKIT